MTEKNADQDEGLESFGTTKWYQEKDFWFGFVGWFGINGIAWVLIINMYGFGFLEPALLLINVGALIYFARKNRKIAFGLLSANTVNLVLVILQGAAYKAICFTPFFIDLPSYWR